MTNVRDRLAELGITLGAAVPPLAAYVPVVIDGSTIYLAGQLPLVGGALELTGKVGAEVTPEQAAAQARVCVINALAALDEAGELDRVVGVLRVVGYVASDPSFTGQSAVVNGASNLLLEIFGEAGRHSRSSVGVAALPLNAPVEIELTLSRQA